MKKKANNVVSACLSRTQTKNRNVLCKKIFLSQHLENGLIKNEYTYRKYRSSRYDVAVILVHLGIRHMKSKRWLEKI